MRKDRRKASLARIVGGMLVVLLAAATAQAGKWSRAYISRLPDEAFAGVEVTPVGKKLRHLPHHDAAGNLDVPHLLSALSRWPQVKWGDPGNRDAARAHLLEHLRQHRAERVAALGTKLPMDLNRATAAELAQLPLVGPARARAIVAHRERAGPFRRVEDLRGVRGIGPVILEAIKDLVTVGPS